MEKYSKKTAEFTNRWEDGKVHNLPQDYADMIGWKELADLVINTYKNLPEESKKNFSIFADEYGTAGAIFFMGKIMVCRNPYVSMIISFSGHRIVYTRMFLSV